MLFAGLHSNKLKNNVSRLENIILLDPVGRGLMGLIWLIMWKYIRNLSKNKLGIPIGDTAYSVAVPNLLERAGHYAPLG